MDRTDMEITLLDGKEWRSSPGPITVTAINTIGDEAGWVTFGGGVHVAEVVEDIDSDITGGIEVFPMGTKVYQSALQEKIDVTGSGFKAGMQFKFEPDIQEGVHYDLEIQSKNKAVMKLKSGKKWRSDAGFIIAKAVVVNNKQFSLAGADGIRVAVVLADPTISTGSESFHETQSKVIAISGHGFTNVADTKVIIRPTAPGAYKILAVLEGLIECFK